MPTPPTAGFDFGDVDAGARPNDAVRYLDAISTLEQVGRYKKRAIDQIALSPGEHVLDLGCGLGDDLVALAERVGPQGRAVGVDRSATLLEQARARPLPEGLRVELHEASASALPFPDESFDAVRCDRVLVHLTEVDAALREILRVLRPGGRFVATEPDWDTLTLSSRDRSTTRTVIHAITDSYASGLVGRELPGLLREAGFVEIDLGFETLVFSAFSPTDAFWGVTEQASACVASGSLEEEVCARWLRELHEREQQGTFCSTLTGFGARARRPSR